MTFPLSRSTQACEQTEALGQELAEAILADASLPRFVALYGDLGVGKTAFVRGFTRAIAPDAGVRSPTFALVNEYRAKREGKPFSVFHFDMYRITDEDDLYSIGFYDYPQRAGICIAEWCENIPYAIPEECICVRIEKTDLSLPQCRLITVCLGRETD